MPVLSTGGGGAGALRAKQLATYSQYCRPPFPSVPGGTVFTTSASATAPGTRVQVSDGSDIVGPCLIHGVFMYAVTTSQMGSSTNNACMVTLYQGPTGGETAVAELLYLPSYDPTYGWALREKYLALGVPIAWQQGTRLSVAGSSNNGSTFEMRARVLLSELQDVESFSV